MRGTKTIHGTVDVYPVGILSDLLLIKGSLRAAGHRREAMTHGLRGLRSNARRMATYAHAGNWRALKNTLNGYLAEPTWADHEPPWWHRTGTGWTKSRALRSLDRHIAGANPNMSPRV